MNGLILKGCYCSINVAVKRLLPPSNPSYKSVFGRTVAENQEKLQGKKAGPRVRRLSAAKAKGSDSRPSSPLLASTDSQVGHAKVSIACTDVVDICPFYHAASAMSQRMEEKPM